MPGAGAGLIASWSQLLPPWFFQDGAPARWGSHTWLLQIGKPNRSWSDLASVRY